VRDLRADLLDDAHRLVAEDVAGVDERPEHLVEVQVRAAETARGHPDDRVRRVLDPRIRHVVDTHVAGATVGECSHGQGGYPTADNRERGPAALGARDAERGRFVADLAVAARLAGVRGVRAAGAPGSP